MLMKLAPGCHTFQQLSYSKKLFVLLLIQNLEPLFWDDVVTSILSTRKQSSTMTTMKRTHGKDDKKSQVEIPMRRRIQDQLEKNIQKLQNYATNDSSTDEST
jgi:hypothetical protein